MTLRSVQPRLIEGGIHFDERGSVSHVNDFDFVGVDRFYLIRSRMSGVPRGWVGHRRDQKWFFAAHGEVQVAVVQPDDWKAPSRGLPVSTYILSSGSPQVLHVPPGFATAIVHLTEPALLIVFSSGKVDDARSDAYRFPADQWSIDVTQGT